MTSFFTADFFAANRRRLRESCPDTQLLAVTANGQLQRSGDVTYPFRQDSGFWYLTGLDEPDIILVMDAGEEYLIVPERHSVIELFDGSRDAAGMSARSGIKRILTAGAGWPELYRAVRRHKQVGTLNPLPNYMKFHEFYANPARTALMRRLRGASAGLLITDVRQQLTALRIIKQAPELLAIQRAVDITVETLQEISAAGFKEYGFEYEVEAALTYGFRRRGAAGHSFLPIVANGANACQIHYLDNKAALDRNGLLLMDVGAEVENYAADLTRMFSLNPPSTRQSAVQDALLAVHDYALKQLKPGISFKECDGVIRQFMGDQLIDLGLITRNDTASINRYYPHYSHFLGLDVHDVGDYNLPFEPGMVITMEPGIYIPEEGIGVRVEDDILITADGSKVLSAALKTEL